MTLPRITKELRVGCSYVLGFSRLFLLTIHNEPLTSPLSEVNREWLLVNRKGSDHPLVENHQLIGYLLGVNRRYPY